VYGHWGTLAYEDGSSSLEPNNLSPPEFCAVANFSMSYDAVWGWADRNCDEHFIYMCKVG
jgi:hypothetical protein